MKSSLYNRYYKLGLEYFVNKEVFGLHKPKAATNVIYFSIMLLMIVIANLF